MKMKPSKFYCTMTAALFGASLTACSSNNYSFNKDVPAATAQGQLDVQQTPDGVSKPAPVVIPPVAVIPTPAATIPAAPKPTPVVVFPIEPKPIEADRAEADRSDRAEANAALETAGPGSSRTTENGTQAGSTSPSGCADRSR